jgi:hypothetical protein
MESLKINTAKMAQKETSVTQMHVSNNLKESVLKELSFVVIFLSS